MSGRRRVLAWCLLFSAVSYALLGIAGSVLILVIARIAAGKCDDSVTEIDILSLLGNHLCCQLYKMPVVNC